VQKEALVGADLSGLSDGELMDLAVSSSSLNRRVLVMWLYLKERPQMQLDEWDSILVSCAERELEKRSLSGQGSTSQ
jgi:hypothetical protein